MIVRTMLRNHCLRTVPRVVRGTAIGFALAVCGVAVQAADAAVKMPDCAALEGWASAIDGKDRVAPVEGSRAWIPKAFLAPEFAELFGAPALEWTTQDAKAIGDSLRACGKAAARARRTAARNALNSARGYVVGNLRGVLAHAERKQLAQQRDAGQAARRAERAQSRAAERERAAARQAAERERTEARRQVGRERYAAQQRAETQRRQSRTQAQPQASAPRYQRAAQDPAAGEKLVADYRKKIEKLENFPESLRFLSRWEKEIPQKVTRSAGQAETDALLALAAEKRKAITDYIVDATKRNIDEAGQKTETDRQALERIERMANNIAGANVGLERIREVRAYARERQVPFADRVLADEARKLEDFPETLKGLDKAQRAVYVVRSHVLSRASEPAQKAYLEVARERLTEVAEEALSEFEDALDGLPETPMGLRATEMTVANEKGFQEVAENVRADYEAALKSRREAIAKAIGVKVDEARDKAVAAGGDPDLVGHRFVDRAKGWQLGFRDEKHAILASQRNRSDAPYEVRGDEVVVRGPQISLVLKRSGSGAATKLEGLGFVFVRADR